MKQSADDIKKLTEVFNGIDKNKDGVIFGHELAKAVEECQENYADCSCDCTADWEDIFVEIDLDGDGKLDFNEFISSASDHVKVLTETNLRYIFNFFDQNNDGRLSVDDLM